MRNVAATLITLTGLACAGGFDASQYPSPEALYREAIRAYRSGDCGRARAALQRLVFELPAMDDRQAEAQYYLAECMLADGRELDATRQFRRIADQFPRHRLAPDALLRAGDAYAGLWKDPELDPTYGETAVATWTELLRAYPASPAAQRAQLRVAELNEQFAEKDFRNGVFYLRLRAFDSAIIYFKDVVAKYPTTSFAPKAVVRLIEAYDRIGYDEDKQDMCGYLEQYYPGTAGAEERCTGG